MQLHAIQLYGSSGRSPTSLSDLILLIVGNGAADTNRDAGAASLPHRPTKAPADGNINAEPEARNVLVGNCSIIIVVGHL